jgi:predicted nucleic acid-binding Zn ribbon protein
MEEHEHCFCINCGNELSPGDRFCENCGKPILPADESRGASRSAARKTAREHSNRFMRQRISWALVFALLLIPVVFFIIWKDLGEVSADLWLSLGGFILVTAVLAGITLRKAGGSWQGELQEVIQREQGNQFNFLTDRGKKVTIFGGASMADYFSPGDRVVKIKGYDFPEKIRRDGERQICVVCGKVYPISEKRCRTCRFPSIDPQNYL